MLQPSRHCPSDVVAGYLTEQRNDAFSVFEEQNSLPEGIFMFSIEMLCGWADRYLAPDLGLSLLARNYTGICSYLHRVI